MLRNLAIRLRLTLIVAAGVIGLLTLAVVLLMSERRALYDARVQEVAMLSEVAVGVLEHFHAAEQSGALTREEAQTLARDTLRDIRFGNDDYFYVFGDDGANFVMGPRPELEGTDMIDVADPDGVHIVREFVRLARDGGGAVAYNWPRAGSETPVPKVGYAAPFEPWGWLAGTGVYIDDLDTVFWGEVQRASWIVALVVLATASLAMVIARSIGGPITTTTGVMYRLANGETDITVPYRNQRDEIGKIAAAVEVFRVNAVEKAALEQAQKEAEERAEAEKRATMHTLADEFEAHIGEIVESVSSASSEMRGSAEAMSAIAEETSRQATTVASASQQAAANVQTVAAAADELGSSISEISRQMGLQNTVAEQGVDAASASDTRIKSLAEKVQAIGGVVNLITDIAERTNLLALNATIEAARAGDSGKGFAVVANEVKTLATQTAKATEEIATQIRAVQEETGGAVEAIADIRQKIDKIQEISASVFAAIEQQTAAAAEIGRNTQEASAGTQQVSSSIVGVDDASKQAGESAGDVLTAAAGLSRQSEHLTMEVQQFTARVRAA